MARAKSSADALSSPRSRRSRPRVLRFRGRLDGSPAASMVAAWPRADPPRWEEPMLAPAPAPAARSGLEVGLFGAAQGEGQVPSESYRRHVAREVLALDAAGQLELRSELARFDRARFGLRSRHNPDHDIPALSNGVCEQLIGPRAGDPRLE